MEGFGVSGDKKNLTGRTTNNTAQVAELVNADGVIIDLHTHGAKTEITEDGFMSGEFTNEAIDGQSGDQVVSAHNITESNQDWTRVSKTIVKINKGA